MNLEQSRKAIDEIDQQLVKLFTERMACAAEIAAYKKENNLPVLDAGRERQKLAAISEMAPDDLENSARCLYSLIFSLSRAYQHRLLGNDAELPKKIAAAIESTPNLFPPKAMVACQGVEGAYSQLACEKLFQAPNILYFSNFEAVFSAIEKGLCQYGIIPLENSTPQRSRFSCSLSRPLSAIAWSAAIRASWVKRSIFLASRLPSKASMSSPFTSPASLHLKSVVSNWVMGPMPHWPAFAAAQLSAAVLPSGFTVPRPVITTLRFSIENFSFYIAMPPSTQSTCPVR